MIQYIYVDPLGKASNTGAAGSPFRSAIQAVQAARVVKAAGDTPVIRFATGIHYLGQPLVLDARDSGLTLEADTGATPVLSAGRPIGPWTQDISGLWTTPIPPEFAANQYRMLWNRLNWVVPFTFPGNEAASIKTARITRDPNYPAVAWNLRYASLTLRINGAAANPVVPEGEYLLTKTATSPLTYRYADASRTITMVIPSEGSASGVTIKAANLAGTVWWSISPAVAPFEYEGEFAIPTTPGTPGTPGTYAVGGGGVRPAFVLLLTWESVDQAPCSAVCTLWPPYDDLPVAATGTHDGLVKHIWSTSYGRVTVTGSSVYIPPGAWYSTVLDDTIAFSRSRSLLDITGWSTPDGDVPGSSGSWGIDTNTQLLWADCDSGDAIPPTMGTMHVATAEQAIVLRGTRGAPVTGVTLRNLTVAHAGWKIPDLGTTELQASNNTNAGEYFPSFDLPAAVEAEWAEDCLFDHLTVTCCEGCGVGIKAGSKRIALSYCAVTTVGASGVMVGARGYGDRIDTDWAVPTDAPADCTIHDCTISGVGQLNWGACGIVVHFATGTDIRYNEIKESYYSGVSIGFNWMGVVNTTHNTVVRNNYIHHCMLALADGGGVYTVGPQVTSDVQDNYITDLQLSLGAKDTVCVALYLDQTSAGVTMVNNYGQRISWGLIHWNAASPLDNDVHDNILLGDADPPPAFAYGPR